MSEQRLSYPDDLSGWLPDPGVHVTTWNGRRCVEVGRDNNGYVLLARDIDLGAYRFETDIALPERRGFAGLVFAATDVDNSEMVYVSPDTESGSGEIQYELMMGGSGTWQIYRGPSYQAKASVPPGEWVHLIVDVYPERVAVFVGDASAPKLVIPHRPRRAGRRIGAWGYPAYIGEITVRPLSGDGPDASARPATSSGAILRWHVLQVDPSQRPAPPPLDEGWREASSEANGTLNLNRLFAYSPGATVYAAAELVASKAGPHTLNVGFSDRLRLWVNDALVCSGEHRWNPPGGDGRIRPDVAQVPVNLAAGTNRIVAELITDEPYGWGISISHPPV